ncbi:Gfo/Idh/MocA family oxidoreductase [Candidatus Pelagibacter sp.]|jgi:predicted dehydrogenase|nr:Gfo/Idh/MocA family oxidoreductase [Candidatus Pelagibacter sp.]|tara:strand:+ start:1061 stop:2041 length:981 start_codon:yes stop_codon:yes gene_type:complete
MINWGIAGLGRMGNSFASAITEVKNSKLIGIASKSNYKLETFGKNFKIELENRFNNYDELLKSNNIDSIYISTLNNTHVDLIINCIENKKKILCEKPIGLNLTQANLAFEMIKKHKISFYEAIAYRTHPQTKNLLELIYNGEIGKIYKIEASFGFKIKKIKKDSRLFNKDLGGGAILDLGCYPISFFNLFTDKDNKINFKSSEGTHCFTGVDDDAKIRLKIGNNIDAIGTVSLKKNLSNNCKIFGEKGNIIIPSPWLPQQKSYIEVENNKSYYKKFTITEKSLYAHQIENIANLFVNKSYQNLNAVNINESIEIMKILDMWKLSLL